MFYLCISMRLVMFIKRICLYVCKFLDVAENVDCSGVIDVAFVLHSAWTVHPERWRYVTQFVVNIVKQLDVGPNRTRVAVITWSDSAYVALKLNQFTSRQDVVQVAVLYSQSVSK